MSESTKQLPGGREWTKSTILVEGWDSDCHNFRIVPTKGGKAFLLIAFEHESSDDDLGFWVKRFPTVEAAMRQAEVM